MTKPKYPSQLLALLLSVALIWTSGGVLDAAMALPEVFSGPSNLPQFRLMPPGNLGRIVDYYNSASPHPSPAGRGRGEATGEAKPLVILIQDLHAHYGVQKNIAGLLEFLSEKLKKTSSPSAPIGDPAAFKSLDPGLQSAGVTAKAVPFALAVEGASGPIDSSVMALFPDEKVRLAASDYLMREGELTGAEFFAIKRGLPNFLVGAENEKYYFAHRDLFRKTIQDRQELVSSLKTIQHDINELPRYVFHKTKALWEFQKKVEAYDKGEMSTHDFIGLLTQEAARLGDQAIKQSSEGTGSHDRTIAGSLDLKRNFPTLASFAANSRFGTMDEIRSATAEFLTQIQGRLTPQEKKDLQVLAKNKGTTTYYLYLRDLIYQKKLFLAVPPALAQYLEYIHTAQTMGMDRVTHEARELAFRIKLALATNNVSSSEFRVSSSNPKPETRNPKRPSNPAVDLIQVQHDLDLLLRLSDLQATEYEVRDFAPRLNQFVALTKSLVGGQAQPRSPIDAFKGRGSPDNLIMQGTGQGPAPTHFDETKIRRLISSSIDFYVMALVRNKPMIENTLALLRPTSNVRRPTSDLGPRTAVLVAGGFHTAQLTAMLREKNVSYLIISPTVDKLTEADHDLYIKRLSGNHLTEDEILADAERKSVEWVEAIKMAGGPDLSPSRISLAKLWLKIPSPLVGEGEGEGSKTLAAGFDRARIIYTTSQQAAVALFKRLSPKKPGPGPLPTKPPQETRPSKEPTPKKRPGLGFNVASVAGLMAVPLGAADKTHTFLPFIGHALDFIGAFGISFFVVIPGVSYIMQYLFSRNRTLDLTLLGAVFPLIRARFRGLPSNTTGSAAVARRNVMSTQDYFIDRKGFIRTTSASPSVTQSNPIRILVVTRRTSQPHMESMLMGLKGRESFSDIKVVVALEEAAARAATKTQHFDLVIAADTWARSGLSIANGIREDNPNIPMIVLTNENVPEKAKKMGIRRVFREDLLWGRDSETRNAFLNEVTDIVRTENLVITPDVWRKPPARNDMEGFGPSGIYGQKNRHQMTLDDLAPDEPGRRPPADKSAEENKAALDGLIKGMLGSAPETLINALLTQRPKDRRETMAIFKAHGFSPSARQASRVLELITSFKKPLSLTPDDEAIAKELHELRVDMLQRSEAVVLPENHQGPAAGYVRVVEDEDIRKALDRLPSFLFQYLGLEIIRTRPKHIAELAASAVRNVSSILRDKANGQERLLSIIRVDDIPRTTLDFYIRATVGSLNPDPLPHSGETSSLEAARAITRYALLHEVGELLWKSLDPSLQSEWSKLYPRSGVSYARNVTRPDHVEGHIIGMDKITSYRSHKEALDPIDVAAEVFADRFAFYYEDANSPFHQLGELPLSSEETTFIQKLLTDTEVRTQKLEQFPGVYQPTTKASNNPQSIDPTHPFNPKRPVFNRQDDGSPGMPAPPAPQPPGSTSFSTEKIHRILIAEDHPMVRAELVKLLARKLADMGLHVQFVQVSNGREALEQFGKPGKEAKPFDLIITDINMAIGPEDSGIDGNELTAQLRKSGFKGPIFVHSTHDLNPEKLARSKITAGFVKLRDTNRLVIAIHNQLSQIDEKVVRELAASFSDAMQPAVEQLRSAKLKPEAVDEVQRSLDQWKLRLGTAKDTPEGKILIGTVDDLFYNAISNISMAIGRRASPSVRGRRLPKIALDEISHMTKWLGLLRDLPNPIRWTSGPTGVLLDLSTPALTLPDTYDYGIKFYRMNPDALARDLARLERLQQGAIVQTYSHDFRITIRAAQIRRATELFLAPALEKKDLLDPNFIARHTHLDENQKVLGETTANAVRNAVRASMTGGYKTALILLRQFAVPLHLGERLGEEPAAEVLNLAEYTIWNAFAPNSHVLAKNPQKSLDILNHVMHFLHNLANRAPLTIGNLHRTDVDKITATSDLFHHLNGAFQGRDLAEAALILQEIKSRWGKEGQTGLNEYQRDILLPAEEDRYAQAVDQMRSPGQTVATADVHPPPDLPSTPGGPGGRTLLAKFDGEGSDSPGVRPSESPEPQFWRRVRGNLTFVDETKIGSANWTFLKAQKHTGLTYRSLYSADLKPGDVPYTEGLQARRPSRSEIPSVQVTFEGDIFLLSKGKNGSQANVRLAALARNEIPQRPVAVIGYERDPAETEEQYEKHMARRVRGAQLAHELGANVFHGIFTSKEGRQYLVVDVLSGDQLENASEFVTAQSIQEFRELHRRLVADHLSDSDLQFHVTTGHHIGLIDTERLTPDPFAPQMAEPYGPDFLRRIAGLLNAVSESDELEMALSDISREDPLLLQKLYAWMVRQPYTTRSLPLESLVKSYFPRHPILQAVHDLFAAKPFDNAQGKPSAGQSGVSKEMAGGMMGLTLISSYLSPWLALAILPFVIVGLWSAIFGTPAWLTSIIDLFLPFVSFPPQRFPKSSRAPENTQPGDLLNVIARVTPPQVTTPAQAFPTTQGEPLGNTLNPKEPWQMTRYEFEHLASQGKIKPYNNDKESIEAVLGNSKPVAAVLKSALPLARQHALAYMSLPPADPSNPSAIFAVFRPGNEEAAQRLISAFEQFDEASKKVSPDAPDLMFMHMNIGRALGYTEADVMALLKEKYGYDAVIQQAIKEERIKVPPSAAAQPPAGPRDFTISANHSNENTSEAQIQFGKDVRIPETIDLLVSELQREKGIAVQKRPDGRWDLRSVIEEHGEIRLASGAALRLQDVPVTITVGGKSIGHFLLGGTKKTLTFKTLVLIDPRFRGAHAGRNEFAAYAPDEATAAHEVTELQKATTTALKIGIATEDDVRDHRLGTRYLEWLNPTDAAEGARREAQLMPIRKEWHIAGLQAEFLVRYPKLQTLDDKQWNSIWAGLMRQEQDADSAWKAAKEQETKSDENRWWSLYFSFGQTIGGLGTPKPWVVFEYESLPAMVESSPEPGQRHRENGSERLVWRRLLWKEARPSRLLVDGTEENRRQVEDTLRKLNLGIPVVLRSKQKAKQNAYYHVRDFKRSLESLEQGGLFSQAEIRPFTSLINNLSIVLFHKANLADLTSEEGQLLQQITTDLLQRERTLNQPEDTLVEPLLEGQTRDFSIHADNSPSPTLPPVKELSQQSNNVGPQQQFILGKLSYLQTLLSSKRESYAHFTNSIRLNLSVGAKDILAEGLKDAASSGHLGNSNSVPNHPFGAIAAVAVYILDKIKSGTEFDDRTLEALQQCISDYNAHPQWVEATGHLSLPVLFSFVVSPIAGESNIRSAATRRAERNLLRLVKNLTLLPADDRKLIIAFHLLQQGMHQGDYVSSEKFDLNVMKVLLPAALQEINSSPEGPGADKIRIAISRALLSFTGKNGKWLSAVVPPETILQVKDWLKAARASDSKIATPLAGLRMAVGTLILFLNRGLSKSVDQYLLDPWNPKNYRALREINKTLETVMVEQITFQAYDVDRNPRTILAQYDEIIKALDNMPARTDPPAQPPAESPKKPAEKSPPRNVRNPDGIEEEITLDPGAYPDAVKLFPSFKEYMDDALHNDEWGYYTSGRVRFGDKGDFWTYPMVMAPYFGQMLAEHTFKMWVGMIQAGTLSADEMFTVAEFGGGTGELAYDFLSFVTQRARDDTADGKHWRKFATHLKYVLYERSPALRKQQQERNKEFDAMFQSKPGDARNPLSTIPEGSIKGVVVSNELPDAFGVHKVLLTKEGQARAAIAIPHIDKRLFDFLTTHENLAGLIRREDQKARELIGLHEQDVYYLTRETFDAVMAIIYRQPKSEIKSLLEGLYFQESYLPAGLWPDLLAHLTSNVNEYAFGLAQEDSDAVMYMNVDGDNYLSGAAKTLKSGYVITIDYGDTTQGLFDSAKKPGQLFRLYKSMELTHSHPYLKPGLYDMTSDQDFSSMARVGEESGLSVIHYGIQGDLVSGTSLDADSLKNSRETFRYHDKVTEYEIGNFLSGAGGFKVLVQQKTGTDANFTFSDRPSKALFTSPNVMTATLQKLTSNLKHNSAPQPPASIILSLIDAFIEKGWLAKEKWPVERRIKWGRIGMRVEQVIGFGISLASLFHPMLAWMPALFAVAHWLPEIYTANKQSRAPPVIGFGKQLLVLGSYGISGLLTSLNLPLEFALPLAVIIGGLAAWNQNRYDNTVFGALRTHEISLFSLKLLEKFPERNPLLSKEFEKLALDGTIGGNAGPGSRAINGAINYTGEEIYFGIDFPDPIRQRMRAGKLYSFTIREHLGPDWRPESYSLFDKDGQGNQALPASTRHYLERMTAQANALLEAQRLERKSKLAQTLSLLLSRYPKNDPRRDQAWDSFWGARSPNGELQGSPELDRQRPFPFVSHPETWDAEVQNEYQRKNYDRLAKLALGKEIPEEPEYNTQIRKQAPDAVAALETLLMDGDGSSRLPEMFAEIAAKSPERIQSVLDLFEKFFAFRSNMWNQYLTAFSSLLELNKRKPGLMTPSLIDAVGVFLQRPIFMGEAHRLLKEVAESPTAQKSGLDVHIVRTLENVLKKEGLDPENYFLTGHVLKELVQAKPSLNVPHSLTFVLMTLPEYVWKHSLAHYEIYLDPYFQLVTREMPESRRYSVALAVYRLLLRHKNSSLHMSEENIHFATDFILSQRNPPLSQVEPLMEIGHHVVAISHQDKNFSKEDLRALATSAGVSQESIQSFKGPQDKENILSAILSTPGPITLLFDGHGGRNHLWLGAGLPGEEDSTDMRNTNAISFVELADAIAKRTHPNDVSILLSSCYSYNFSVQLLNRLSQKGLTPRAVAASSNYDRLSRTSGPSTGGLFIGELRQAIPEKQSLRISDVLAADENSFESQDAAIFIPLTEVQQKQLIDRLGQVLNPTTPAEHAEPGQQRLAISSLELTGPDAEQTLNNHGTPLELPKSSLELGQVSWRWVSWVRSKSPFLANLVETVILTVLWIAGLYFLGDHTLLLPILISAVMSLLHGLGRDPNLRKGEQGTLRQRFFSGQVTYGDGRTEAYGLANGLKLTGLFILFSIPFMMAQGLLLGSGDLIGSILLSRGGMVGTAAFAAASHLGHFPLWNNNLAIRHTSIPLAQLDAGKDEPELERQAQEARELLDVVKSGESTTTRLEAAAELWKRIHSENNQSPTLTAASDFFAENLTAILQGLTMKDKEEESLASNILKMMVGVSVKDTPESQARALNTLHAASKILRNDQLRAATIKTLASIVESHPNAELAISNIISLLRTHFVNGRFPKSSTHPSKVYLKAFNMLTGRLLDYVNQEKNATSAELRTDAENIVVDLLRRPPLNDAAYHQLLERTFNQILMNRSPAIHTALNKLHQVAISRAEQFSALKEEEAPNVPADIFTKLINASKPALNADTFAEDVLVMQLAFKSGADTTQALRDFVRDRAVPIAKSIRLPKSKEANETDRGIQDQIAESLLGAVAMLAESAGPEWIFGVTTFQRIAEDSAIDPDLRGSAMEWLARLATEESGSRRDEIIRILGVLLQSNESNFNRDLVLHALSNPETVHLPVEGTGFGQLPKTLQGLAYPVIDRVYDNPRELEKFILDDELDPRIRLYAGRWAAIAASAEKPMTSQIRSILENLAIDEMYRIGNLDPESFRRTFFTSPFAAWHLWSLPTSVYFWGSKTFGQDLIPAHTTLQGLPEFDAIHLMTLQRYGDGRATYNNEYRLGSSFLERYGPRMVLLGMAHEVGHNVQHGIGFNTKSESGETLLDAATIHEENSDFLALALAQEYRWPWEEFMDAIQAAESGTVLSDAGLIAQEEHAAARAQTRELITASMQEMGNSPNWKRLFKVGLRYIKGVAFKDATLAEFTNALANDSFRSELMLHPNRAQLEDQKKPTRPAVRITTAEEIIKSIRGKELDKTLESSQPPLYPLFMALASHYLDGSHHAHDQSWREKASAVLVGYVMHPDIDLESMKDALIRKGVPEEKAASIAKYITAFNQLSEKIEVLEDAIAVKQSESPDGLLDPIWQQKVSYEARLQPEEIVDFNSSMELLARSHKLPKDQMGRLTAKREIPLYIAPGFAEERLAPFRVSGPTLKKVLEDAEKQIRSTNPGLADKIAKTNIFVMKMGNKTQVVHRNESIDMTKVNGLWIGTFTGAAPATDKQELAYTPDLKSLLLDMLAAHFQVLYYDKSLDLDKLSGAKYWSDLLGGYDRYILVQKELSFMMSAAKDLAVSTAEKRHNQMDPRVYAAEGLRALYVLHELERIRKEVPETDAERKMKALRLMSEQLNLLSMDRQRYWQSIRRDYWKEFLGPDYAIAKPVLDRLLTAWQKNRGFKRDWIPTVESFSHTQTMMYEAVEQAQILINSAELKTADDIQGVQAQKDWALEMVITQIQLWQHRKQVNMEEVKQPRYWIDLLGSESVYKLVEPDIQQVRTTALLRIQYDADVLKLKTSFADAALSTFYTLKNLADARMMKNKTPDERTRKALNLIGAQLQLIPKNFKSFKRAAVLSFWIEFLGKDYDTAVQPLLDRIVKAIDSVERYSDMDAGLKTSTLALFKAITTLDASLALEAARSSVAETPEENKTRAFQILEAKFWQLSAEKSIDPEKLAPAGYWSELLGGYEVYQLVQEELNTILRIARLQAEFYGRGAGKKMLDPEIYTQYALSALMSLRQLSREREMPETTDRERYWKALTLMNTQLYLLTIDRKNYWDAISDGYWREFLGSAYDPKIQSVIDKILVAGGATKNAQGIWLIPAQLDFKSFEENAGRIGLEALSEHDGHSHFDMMKEKVESAFATPTKPENGHSGISGQLNGKIMGSWGGALFLQLPALVIYLAEHIKGAAPIIHLLMPVIPSLIVIGSIAGLVWAFWNHIGPPIKNRLGKRTRMRDTEQIEQRAAQAERTAAGTSDYIPAIDPPTFRQIPTFPDSISELFRGQA